MRQHETKEIISRIQSIYDAENEKNYCRGWEPDGCIAVLKNTPQLVEIEIRCMYEAQSPNYGVLKQIAEFFETENVNDDDAFSDSGCESCDYGSSYGYTLRVRP